MKARWVVTAMLCACVIMAFGDKKESKQEQVQSKIDFDQIDEFIGAGKKGISGGNFIKDSVKVQSIIKIEAIRKGEKRLYAKLVKRYGRWEGYGKPISKDFASHTSCYYRLTYLDGGKYPARVEALDGYHQLTTSHDMGTYLVDQFSDTDKGADKEWVEKLKSVCQWDFVYNSKGEVVMERAYDLAGDMVYSYYPVKVGDKVAGTYTDNLGMPAKLRSDSIGGGNVVYISYDENGFENLLEFMDENGYRRTNKDGAYMTRRTYTDDGLKLSEASCNIAGVRTIDNFGNCGFTLEYSVKGDSVFQTSRDDQWNPIRLRNDIDPYTNNVVKALQRYDKYGRLIEVAFFNTDNQPDVNGLGIHKTKHTYNERGRKTSVAFYDIEGKLINGEGGWASWENEFDKEGRRVVYRSYNAQRKAVNVNGNCSGKIVYNNKGEQIARYDSMVVDDKIVLQSSSVLYSKTVDACKPLSIEDTIPKDYVEWRTFYDENMSIYIEQDKQGRNIRWEYFDLKGNPIMYADNFSKEINTYIDKDSITFNTDVYLNEEGKWLKGSGYVSYKKNGREVSRDYFDYGSDSTFSTLSDSYRFTFNKKGETESQMTLNRFGIPARTAADGVIYYKVNVSRSLKGDISTFVARNEFDEPAYFESGGMVCHYCNYWNNSLIYYDEKGNLIPDMVAFKDSIPAVMCLVITDSVGYKLGLKDNDVIVKYGNWISDMHLQNSNSCNAMYLEMITAALSEKEMLVLRHNPSEKSSAIVRVPLPKGTIQELGFFPQLVYYTPKEKERYKDAVKTYLAKEHLSVLGRGSYVQGSHSVIISIPKGIARYMSAMGNTKPYVYNPGFMLSLAGYEVEDDKIMAHQYWNLGMGNDTLLIAYQRGKREQYYISTTLDLSSSDELYPYNSDNHSLEVVWINDELYARLQEVFGRFMKRRGDTFDKAYLAQSIAVDKKLTPRRFFEGEKKKGFTVIENAMGVINADSTVLSKAFAGLQRISISKIVSPDEYESVLHSMQAINQNGYVKLPNFYNEDLALVKKDGSSFSELFLIYRLGKRIDIYYQKGKFTREDILAFQRHLGKKGFSYLGVGIDVQQVALVNVDGEMGTFILTQHNQWKLGQDLEMLKEEIGNSRHTECDLAFIRLNKDENNNWSLGEYKRMKFPVDILDVKIVGFDYLPIELYEEVVSRMNSGK